MCASNDIVFLQETWLSSQEVHILGDIDREFYVRMQSSVDVSSTAIRGQVRGGIAVMWRKSLAGVKVLDSEDKRLMCVELCNKHNKVLFLNVYMPWEKDDHFDEFVHYMSMINGIIVNHPFSHSCIVGDFNADISDNSSKFGN